MIAMILFWVGIVLLVMTLIFAIFWRDIKNESKATFLAFFAAAVAKFVFCMPPLL